MTNHLFLFTLGPVQSFIAQARKTQDLYAGSEILSALIRKGIEAFKQEFAVNEYKLIFPSESNTNSSLPNQFIGSFSRNNLTDKDLREKAEMIKASVEMAFYTFANEALEEAGNIAPKGFEEQLKAHLDVFWAYQELKDLSYRSAFKSLKGLAEAVKNVRSFEQFAYDSEITFGEVGRKCSVDGQNNALFYRKNGQNIPAFLEKATNVKGFALNPGEGLSAISLLKRYFPNTTSFPSTSEVALMHDESKLDEDGKKLLGCYKMLLKKETLAEACIQMFTNGWIKKAQIINPKDNEHLNKQFDYQMLYEENLTPKNIPDSSQLELVLFLHAKLKTYLKNKYAELKTFLNTKYYAVILFDGDKMGQWLSGDNNQREEDLESFHGKLSDLLSAFSNHAYKSLDKKKYNGHAVYAGGDDFLGFVNIHQLFEVMRLLRKDFHKMVNSEIDEFKKPGKHLTFSAGIVIAHYKMPFSEVLKKAREIEKKAKKEGGRNAFGITVLKHSGEVQEAVYHWDGDERSPDGCSNWDALEKIVNALDKDGAFSNTFIQNLTTEFYQLTGADLHDIESMSRDAKHLENALLFEIERLVHRSLDKPEAKEEDAKLKTALTTAVQTLWKEAKHPKTRNFIHSLHIADFITRKTDKS